MSNGPETAEPAVMTAPLFPSVDQEPGAPPDNEPAEDISLRRRFLNLKTLLSFGFAIALLVFVFTRMDINPGETFQLVRRANPLWLLVGLIVYYATFPVRGYRWQRILHNVGFHPGEGVKLPSIADLAQIILLGWFANTILVAKLGDMYRGYLLKRQAGVSFSKTIGTIFAERLIDMLVLFAMLALAGIGIARTSSSGAAVPILEVGVVMTVVIVSGLLVMRFFGNTIYRFIPARLQSLYLRFQEGTLDSFASLPSLISLSVVIWLAEAARLFFVVTALDVQVPLPVILFAALANSLLTAVPFTPGGLGLVEAGMIAILGAALSDRYPATSAEIAAGIALLDRVVSYWSVIVFGFLLQVFGRHR